MEEAIPTTLEEVDLSSKKEAWYGAMDEEIRSLKKNENWELGNLPKGKKAIECKWVYTKKKKTMAIYGINLVWLPNDMHEERESTIIRYSLRS